MSEAPKIENLEYDTSLPIMDREQIEMLMMAGDEEEPNSLALELFTLFKTESDEKLEELDKICSERDGDGLRKLVHFIAGTAGNLGMFRLNAFYRSIERAAYEGTLNDYDACARLIPQEYEIACNEYSRILELD